MAQFSHRNQIAHTSGDLPAKGDHAPDCRLTKADLTDTTLAAYAGKRVVLNIFPSIDTGTCAKSVREFNKLASSFPNTVVLCVSKDLPFAQKRFCGAEGIDQVECLSEYKDQSFSKAFHVDITDGSSLIGLMARAVVILDENSKVLYTELVSDISQEPNYHEVQKILA